MKQQVPRISEILSSYIIKFQLKNNRKRQNSIEETSKKYSFGWKVMWNKCENIFESDLLLIIVYK